MLTAMREDRDAWREQVGKEREERRELAQRPRPDGADRGLWPYRYARDAHRATPDMVAAVRGGLRRERPEEKRHNIPPNVGGGDAFPRQRRGV